MIEAPPRSEDASSSNPIIGTQLKAHGRGRPRRSVGQGVAGLLAPKLAQALVAPAALPVGEVAVGILLPEVLVVFLGRVERARLDHLGDDRLAVQGARLLDRLPGGQRRLPLGLGAPEDRASVRLAPVAELAV